LIATPAGSFYNRKLHLDIRRRAIRKREREAAKGAKAQ
jgi:17beta-estradiol 17-dehydrogenase / very-long-chain 3-oxoacyl-CoA reductase